MILPNAKFTLNTWTTLHAGYFLKISSADIIKKKKNQKLFSVRLARVSNSLDPDQDQHFVGRDLGPNCLQWLLADANVTASKERIFVFCLI